MLPGFNLAIGYTLFYLSLLVLIPLAACFVKASSLSFQQFIDVVLEEAGPGSVYPDVRSIAGGGRD